MGHIVYSIKNRESVLDDGVIHGLRSKSRKKGLKEAYPLIVTTVVDNLYNDDAGCCCPRFEDPITITGSMLERVCDGEWLLCRPAKGAVRTERDNEVYTLYLIPSNEEDVQGGYDYVYQCQDMGMSELIGTYMPYEIHDVLQEEFSALPYQGDHLHVYILAAEIQLRPPAVYPGSCNCGNIASPACDYELCSNCCNGCSRHGYPEPARPAAGQPGSCSCGNIASPACDHLLCSNCCQGCSRHGYAEPARPAAGQLGSCSCGNIASPACDNLLCSNCCNGCSRHGNAEPLPPARPAAGQPGSCSCGGIASPACATLLCSNCCSGCSRHGYRQPAGQLGSCRCGGVAYSACDNLRCSNCCSGCRMHPSAESMQPTPPILVMGGGLQVLPPSSNAMAVGGPSNSSSSSTSSCTAAGPAAITGAAPVPGPPSSSSGASSVEASTGSALQLLRTRLLDTIVMYMTTGGLRHSSEDLRPLQDIVDLALDGPMWEQASAEAETAQRASGSKGAAPAASSSSAQTAVASSRRAAAAATAAAGGLSVEEQLHQATHCVVCLDALRDTLLLPCKHLVLCQGCSRHMQQLAVAQSGSSSSSRRALCPVCRVPVASHVPGVILA